MGREVLDLFSVVFGLFSGAVDRSTRRTLSTGERARPSGREIGTPRQTSLTSAASASAHPTLRYRIANKRATVIPQPLSGIGVLAPTPAYASSPTVVGQTSGAIRRARFHF